MSFCADRAAAVDAFLAASRAWADEAEREARGELVFATPGSWDQAYSTDRLAVVAQTRASIAALEAELATIRARADLPRP